MQPRWFSCCSQSNPLNSEQTFPPSFQWSAAVHGVRAGCKYPPHFAANPNAAATLPSGRPSPLYPKPCVKQSGESPQYAAPRSTGRLNSAPKLPVNFTDIVQGHIRNSYTAYSNRIQARYRG